jgi:hypothetical protein
VLCQVFVITNNWDCKILFKSAFAQHVSMLNWVLYLYSKAICGFFLIEQKVKNIGLPLKCMF